MVQIFKKVGGIMHKDLLNKTKLNPDLIYEDKIKALKIADCNIMHFILLYIKDDISHEMTHFLITKIENQIVECNLLGSEDAISFGYKKSRRYNGNGQL